MNQVSDANIVGGSGRGTRIYQKSQGQMDSHLGRGDTGEGNAGISEGPGSRLSWRVRS